MEKVFVAQQVANKLFATETAVDGALAQAADLMGEMLKARRDVNASLALGDVATQRVVDAIKALGEARTAMVGCHSELEEAKLRLGIRTKMGYEDKSYAMAPPAQTTLREVG